MESCAIDSTWVEGKSYIDKCDSRIDDQSFNQS